MAIIAFSNTISSMKDWEKELKKIDQQIEALPDGDEILRPTPAGAPPAVRPGAPVAPTRGSTFGALARLTLAVALGVGIMFWPYEARCGVGLAAYLGAVAVVIGAGVWSSVWTWRHRTARAHVLSLLLVLWGLILGATEVLPRVGYARPTLQHPAIWSCQ